MTPTAAHARTRWLPLALLVGVLGALVLPGVAGASDADFWERYTHGDAFQVSAASYGRIETPAGAASAQGGDLIVAWSSPQTGIVARSLAPGGRPRGEDLVLVPADLPGQAPWSGELRIPTEPEVVPLAGGDFLLLWTEREIQAVSTVGGYFTQLVDTDIHGRRFTPDGRPVGPSFRVSGRDPGYQSGPRAVQLDNFRVAVAWRTAGAPDDASNGVWLRLLRPRGTGYGREFRLDEAAARPGGSPVVGRLGKGRFLVAWGGCCDTGGDEGIFARIVEGDGLPVGEPFLVDRRAQAGDQRNPAVASAADGTALVVWYGPTDASMETYRVYGRRIHPDGQLLGRQIEPSAAAFGQWAHTTPTVAALPGGGWFVSWIGWQGFQQSGIFGVELARGGENLAPPLRLTEEPMGVQETVSVTVSPEGSVLAVWLGLGDAGRPVVFGRRLEARSPGRAE